MKTISENVRAGRAMNTPTMDPDNTQQLLADGYTVLKGVFDKQTITQSRKRIIDNLSLFKNTRPTSSSLHLAGFHRFPKLEPLHTILSSNKTILNFLSEVLKGKDVRSIGLSDITINRSQCWHKDLLRNKFQSYIDDDSISWEKNSAGVYKILFYLQSGSSLKVVSGSHVEKVSLENDHYSEPSDDSLVRSVPVEEGDIVITDVRTSHRGSQESIFQSEEFVKNQCILTSTALGRIDGELTNAMEIGNFYRMIDWMKRNP